MTSAVRPTSPAAAARAATATLRQTACLARACRDAIIPLALALCLTTPLAAQTRAPAAATMGPALQPVGVVPHAPACDACDPSRRIASRAVAPEALSAEGARRSRTRGARIGFFVGAGVGALAGLAITDSFYNGPAVNAAVGAAGFGLLGALIGAVAGAPAR